MGQGIRARGKARGQGKERRTCLPLSSSGAATPAAHRSLRTRAEALCSELEYQESLQ